MSPWMLTASELIWHHSSSGFTSTARTDCARLDQRADKVAADESTGTGDDRVNAGHSNLRGRALTPGALTGSGSVGNEECVAWRNEAADDWLRRA